LLLERIIATLGAGKIYKQGEDFIRVRIESLEGINRVIQFFDEYPLISEKRADFELFKIAVELINRGEHLTIDGLLKS
jgi:hypothetical protein